MNFDNWEYKESELPKEAEKKEELFRSLKAKFLAEVQSNNVVQEWLQQFDDYNWKHFLSYYADYKVNLVKHSSLFIKKTEQVLELKHRNFTQKTLAMILQKKLFNLQCQWRAEQVTLPGIRITFDFWYWSKNIFNCPFIPPVTDAELQIMQRFVQTEDFDPENLYTTTYGWQYYDEIISKIQAEEQDEIVSWYTFYDTYMGTSAYLLLPNIRGQKEEVYYDIVHKKEQQEREAANIVPRPPIEMKEGWWYTVQRCYEMACLFEDPYFVALMKADSEEEIEGDTLENAECDAYSYMVYLENIPNLPPVRAGLSWRMALKYCYVDFLRSFIYQDLFAAHDEYQMYRSMNLYYRIDDKDDNQEPLEDFKMSVHQIKRILEGRAMLGEPEDLNF